MGGLLGGLLGGAGAAQPQAGSAQGGMDMGGLLGSLLGGAGAAQPQASAGQGGMDMGGLLGALLGGAGAAQPQSGAAQGGMDMGGLLGGLLGGMGQSQAGGGGGIGDLLGAVMGGGGAAGGAGSFLTPIVAGLAEKLGLPPQIAQTVVSFVLNKLVGSRLQSTGRATGLGITDAQAASMEEVMQRMASGKRVTKTAVRNAGLVKELAAQTGMNRATAEASLQEVFNALGGQLGTGR